MYLKLCFTALALVALSVEFSPRVTAAGVQVQSASWTGRKFTVCASDSDRPAGERIQIDFFVDNFHYDRLHITNAFPAACGEREFAPFGPRAGGHTIVPLLLDEPGFGSVALPTKSFTEDCSVFTGTNALPWCLSTSPGGIPEYYGNRQAITTPLMADGAWAGVNIDYGGLIQQMYSSDRSYNLIDEHAAGGMGMALWGVSQPAFGPLPACNWPPFPVGPPTEVMHTIFPQGPNCTYAIRAQGEPLGLQRGAVTGMLTYLFNPEHHGRRLTLTNFHIGQMVLNRGDYFEILYGFRNQSVWNFGEIDQEIPALHLNRGVNREYAWSRNEAPGYGYKAVAEGEQWATRLVMPGISPFSGPGTEVWNGHWITVCSDGRLHCLTIAPAAPPSRSGINMANLRANTDVIDTPDGQTKSNQVSLVGRFAIPQSTAITAHTVFVFPYAIIQPLPMSGGTVLTKVYQLQGW